MAWHWQWPGADLIDLLVNHPIYLHIPAMQAAVKNEYVSVADYLAAEETSQIRHEYLGGLVYAMAGETREHNLIAQNLLIQIRQKTKGGPCTAYIGDIRVNFHLHSDEYYYYPDIVVTCDKRDNHPRFVRHPKLIIEVLSPSTQRVDRREKFFAYTNNIESLQEYVLVAQDEKEVTVFRRAKHWKSEKISGAKTNLKLESLGIKIPLAAIYEGI
jgi:Uma2 family endonuclease